MPQPQPHNRLNTALFAVIVACLIIAIIYVAVQMSIRNALPSSVSQDNGNNASSSVVVEQ